MNRGRRILIESGQILLPQSEGNPVDKAALATLMGNLTYFGYGLSRDAFDLLCQVGDTAAREWWAETEPVLRAIVGDDKEMDAHVVYKNFPQEVLSMTEADYWFRQICMYWGLPNSLFTTPEKSRPALDETLPQKVLHPAREDALATIFADLLALPARWTDRQLDDAIYLATSLENEPQLASIFFKENLVALGVACLQQGRQIVVETATDVLRLAVGMSEGDASLRENSKLRGFSRRERRFLLYMLERVPRLEEDLRRRPERMKRLFYALRPGDYADRYPRVCIALDKLYRGQLPKTYNSRIEAALEVGDPNVLLLLQERPGEFARRLRACVLRFGEAAVAAFADIAPRLTTLQLVKLHRYLETVNERATRTFPPRGNWTRLKIVEASGDRVVPPGAISALLAAIAKLLSARLGARVGPVCLDPRAAAVKLQTNDSDLLPYGRGTTFPLPDTVTFIRTASYWASGPTTNNIWYDNGWNFFGETWTPEGACCWTHEKFQGNAAVFSGDPTNAKDLDGRACQIIDLYIDRLLKAGVRYAVWNILCYNRIPFSDAVEVYAALMWGEAPETGKLFEPSRCQLSFPLTGRSLTKYIAYVDIKHRQLVYMDANLSGSVGSAALNTRGLSEKMPAFLEYLDSLPSIYDLFVHAPQAESGLPVLYSDKDRQIDKGTAWVFQQENRDNRFEPLQLGSLLE